MDSENRTDDRRGGTVKERLLDNDNDLVEPLLLHHVDNGDCGDAEHRDCENHGHNGDDGNVVHDVTADVGDENVSDQTRRIASVAIFWAGAAVSCCVSSIDIVWEILGGSPPHDGIPHPSRVVHRFSEEASTGRNCKYYWNGERWHWRSRGGGKHRVS